MIYVEKTMVMISYAVTVQLICAFVFAYAKSGFSNHAAQNDLSLLHRCMFSASLMMSMLILPNVLRDDYQIISCMIAWD